MISMELALDHLERCIANYEYDKGRGDPTPYAKEQKITFLLKTLEYQRQLNTLCERAMVLLNEEYGATDLLQTLLKIATKKPEETTE